MFGTLRPIKGRLGDRHRELHSASYCGACHLLREFGGRRSAASLGYETTALVLFMAGLAGTPAERRACTFVPLRAVAVQSLPREARTLVAALHLGVVAAKLADDEQDERSWKARLARWVLRRPIAKALEALELLGFDRGLVERLPARQHALEARPGLPLEEYAAPSVDLTRAAFVAAARVLGRPEAAPGAAALGAALGGLVYGLDAHLDRDADRQKRRFNALDAASLRDPGGWLSARLDAALEALARLPLGEHGQALAAVLESSRARFPAPRLAREAGVDDCACDAGCCDCCGAGAEAAAWNWRDRWTCSPCNGPRGGKGRRTSRSRQEAAGQDEALAAPTARDAGEPTRM